MGTTNVLYSCYDPSRTSKPYSSGTIINDDGEKIVTTVRSFCSQDLCNTGMPVDNATLWCNLGFKGDLLGNQSCTGVCAVVKHSNGETGYACIPSETTCVADQKTSVVLGDVTINRCCSTNYCNVEIARTTKASTIITSMTTTTTSKTSTKLLTSTNELSTNSSVSASGGAKTRLAIDVSVGLVILELSVYFFF